MIEATKPFMSGNLKYTILAPFGLDQNIESFKSYLSDFFLGESHKEITTLKVGCEKEIAMDYASRISSDYTSVEISSQLLEISDIKDIHKKNIFFNQERIYGWFIFVNENIFANWGHECKYIFFVNKDMLFERCMLLPPDDKFTMEVI